MLVVFTCIPVLSALGLGFCVARSIEDRGSQKTAISLRFVFTGAIALFIVLVIFLFPNDLAQIYYSNGSIISFGMFALLIAGIFFSFGFPELTDRARNDGGLGLRGDTVWYLLLGGVFCAFSTIWCFGAHFQSLQAYQTAYQSAPVNYQIEESAKINASASVDKFEIDGEGSGGLLFFAYRMHGETSTSVRIWKSIQHPAYPDRTTIVQQDYIVDDNLIYAYILPDEVPHIETGVFMRDMPEPFHDEVDRRITTLFIPENAIVDIGISVN